MNKSPINVLQEVLIKEGCFPVYSHSLDVSNFKCEVTCKNLNATGTGANKKEAKHNAAVNMLSLLNITVQSKEHETKNKIQDLKVHQPTCNNYESEDKNTSPLLNRQTFPEYNYIGFLQELCVQHRLDYPLYTLVQQSGPSHMRIFKVKSSIGSYEETGIAYCKKAAKQEAAKNILHVLIVSKILPEDAYNKIENYKKKVCDDIQDLTTGNCSSEIVETILPTKVSEKTLSTYVESISNNIIDNSSTALNNSTNTIKNTYINTNQSKSIEMVNDCDQTLENNFKNIDVTKSVVKSTHKSENAQSNYIESNTDSTNKQDSVTTDNNHVNLSSALINKNQKRTIEDDLRDFNIEISDFKTLPLTELSKSVLTSYITSETSKNSYKCKSSTNMCLRESHNLFKDLYSDKISGNLRKKMYTVSRLNSNKFSEIQEMFQDVKSALGVPSEQINCCNSKTGLTIIGLRVLSTPIMAQIGVGTSINKAEAEAMLAVINTILEYLK